MQLGADGAEAALEITTMTERILRRREVEARTGLSRSTLYAQMAEGTFPKPVRLGKRAVGWTESTISEWLESRITSDAA